jgi:ElaB/YqjD/DUF883 family membrane-anchored ribosome-binding protein
VAKAPDDKDDETMATTKATTAARPAAKKAAPSRAKAAPAKRTAPPKAPPAPETLRDQAGALASKASEKAKDAAQKGMNHASDALDNVSQMAEDVARTIDEKLGANYGEFARRAASGVASIATSLKSKEVEDLLHDTRDFIRKRPGVAIGAAAAVGFVLTRLVKAGSDDEA